MKRYVLNSLKCFVRIALKGVSMPNEPIKNSSNAKKINPLRKKPRKQQQSITKESISSLDMMEVMEKKIKQHSSKNKKILLNESALNPRAKELLEELSAELGVSKAVIVDLAITLYRLYKDKV